MNQDFTSIWNFCNGGDLNDPQLTQSNLKYKGKLIEIAQEGLSYSSKELEDVKNDLMIVPFALLVAFQFTGGIVCFTIRTALGFKMSTSFTFWVMSIIKKFNYFSMIHPGTQVPKLLKPTRTYSPNVMNY